LGAFKQLKAARPKVAMMTTPAKLVNSVALKQAMKLFKTGTAIQKHIDVGKHCFRPQKDSAYDAIKRKWAYACTSFVHLMCLLRNPLGI